MPAKLDPAVGLNHQDLMTQFDAINTQLGNQCLSSAGLAIGTGANTSVKIVNTVTFTNGHAFASKTTAEVAFGGVADNIPANANSIQERCWLLTLTSAGTPTLTAGAIASGAGNATFPEIPAGGTVIGGIRIAVNAAAPGAGTNFVANTTALNDARMTTTYYNYGYYAPRFDAAQ